MCVRSCCPLESRQDVQLVPTATAATATAAEAQLQLGELSEEFAAYKAEWRQRVVDMQAEMAEFLENLKTR